ncbi:S49 family peptidase [Yoonia sp.]|uniref:S49 family peptidase n=1 Tax=Yoonia sp. TaxID=2212373 RepID=UPI0025E04AE5|nr:S49 family peptidase [Yoonia sp.]
MKRFIPFVTSDPVVAVIRLQGAIANSGRGLDNPGLAPVIEKAFSRGKPAAVALEINCPGGSPVQSSLIASRIRRLADEKKIPVFAFVEDVAASGGYWLACAADEIFVDACSITGSIGVISSGFGAHEAIANYGIERRVHTSGKSKSMLDPFKKQDPADVTKLKGWLEDLHATFIAYVQSRRGLKLADNPDLFTGEVFIGQRGIDAGLVDGIGHLVPTMKQRFGDNVRFRRYDQKRPLLARFGAQIVGNTVAGIDERAAFARYGL